jgi:hypothetical protein
MMMNQNQVEVKASKKFGARPYGDPWTSRHGTTGEERRSETVPFPYLVKGNLREGFKVERVER